MSAKAHKSPRAHRVTWNPSMFVLVCIESKVCRRPRKRVMEPAKPTSPPAEVSLEKRRRAMYKRAVKELPAHHHLQALRYRYAFPAMQQRSSYLSKSPRSPPTKGGRHCKISKADNPLSPPVRNCVFKSPQVMVSHSPMRCGNLST